LYNHVCKDWNGDVNEKEDEDGDEDGVEDEWKKGKYLDII
jgi:hypothetical protein